jgi:hypothetical protein
MFCKNNITDMTHLKIKIVEGFDTIKKEKLCNIYEKLRKITFLYFSSK